MSDYVSCPTCHGKGLVPLEEAARIEQHENAFVEQARARGAQPPSADRFPKGPRTVQVRYVKRDDEQPKGPRRTIHVFRHNEVQSDALDA